MWCHFDVHRIPEANISADLISAVLSQSLVSFDQILTVHHECSDGSPSLHDLLSSLPTSAAGLRTECNNGNFAVVSAWPEFDQSPVWRSTTGRNCRYFSFRASVSRLGFAPRVSRLLRPVASTSSTPLCVPWQGSRTPMETTSGVALLHSIVQHWNTCSMFKFLFIANATRSRSTLRRNMVEYQMVRGVKPRRENLE